MNSAFLVTFVLLVVVLEMWNYYIGSRTCRYCGAHRGEHEQNCPYDFINREER